MAQTGDEIAEILSEIRVQNENSKENLEKVLSGINTKLELMSDENGISDLLRLYISELKKSVEDRHDTTLTKLNDLNNSLGEVVKSSDFSGFRSDLAEFVQKIIDNSSALNSEISYSSEKIENIMTALRAIDFRNDFANVVEKIADVKETFENGAKVNFDNLSSEMTNLSNKFNESFQNLDYGRQNIYADLKAQLSSILDNIKAVSQAANEDSYFDVKDYISEVNESVNNLRSEFQEISSANSGNIVSQISELKSLIDSLKEEFHQNASASVENSSNLASGLTDISNKIYSLENSFNNGSASNFEALKSMLDGLSEKLSADFEQQKELFNSNALNALQLDGLQKISDDIKAIDSAIYESSNTFGQTVKDNLADIKGYISEMSSSITLAKVESDEKLYTKLANLDVLSNTFEASISGLNSGVKNVLDNVLGISNTTGEIKSKTDGIIGSLTNVLSSIEGVVSKNNELSSLVGNLSGMVLKKDDLYNLESKVNENVDYIASTKGKLDDIENRLNELKSFDYSFDIQQIASKIDDLSILFENTSNNNYSGLSQNFENIAGSINDIKASFENNSKMNYESIINEINNLKSEINSNINSINNAEAIEQINASISDLLSNVQFLRDVSTQRYSEIMDNLVSELNNTLSRNNEDINSNAETNFGELKSLVGQNLEKIDNLRQEFISNNISDEKLLSIKDMISKLSANIELAKVEYEQHLKENNETNSAQMRVVSDNVDSVKSHISEAIEDLKNTLSEFSQASREINFEGGEKLSQKLIDIEASIVQLSQDYDNKINLIQGSLTEFAHIVEGSNADTEGKISSSLDEIETVKNELSAVSDILKSFKIGNDEKLNEVVSLLDAGVENVIFNVNALNESIKAGVDSSVKENISLIEEKYGEISEILSNLKNEFSSDEIYKEIEDKLVSLNEELKYANNAISEALEAKSEEIVRAFEPIKIGIDEFLGFDFEKLLSGIKSQVEMAFMNFSADLNGEILANTNSFSRLENAFKESYNKINEIEDCVKDKLQNDLELLNNTMESGLREFKHNFDAKFEDQLNDIKAHIDVALNHTDIISAIQNIKDSGKEILENSFKNIENKNNLLKSSIDVLDQKLDALSLDGTTESLFDELYERLESDKSDVQNSLNNLATKIGEVSKNDSLQEMFEMLNVKIDAIAQDSTIDSIVEEIDDIKNIIFEQRKFFEASSDEKSAAIDKYLRDVLVKLDNVDIEKNAEDIKESILGALISVVDQISFVEETEEIKDFVEEKTSEINQGIKDVQSQLKQLVTSDDAFDYTYTLQDVESDIARLRLAINNLTAGDFSNVTDEIKKITESIENLENSLTQDEVSSLKNDIEKLNEDILSISSRTNKLLLNSDESYKALNEGLDSFSKIIYKLEDRINYLDNTKTTERIEKKIDNIQTLAATSANADKVFHQAMMYLGEWVDATSQDLSTISDKAGNIENVKQNLQEVQKDIEEVRSMLPDKQEVIDRIEKRFEAQNERIDLLENKLEKIISILDEKDDMVLNRKVEKIEKMLSILGNNIEKLTSYVDEE